MTPSLPWRPCSQPLCWRALAADQSWASADLPLPLNEGAAASRLPPLGGFSSCLHQEAVQLWAADVEMKGEATGGTRGTCLLGPVPPTPAARGLSAGWWLAQPLRCAWIRRQSHAWACETGRACVWDGAGGSGDGHRDSRTTAWEHWLCN